MDKLEKAKIITMRDFLLRMLIEGSGIQFTTITERVVSDRANAHGYMAYNPVRVTKSGLAYLEKWKDLK